MALSPLDGADLSDPCAVVPVLEKVLLDLMVGAAVARGRFGEDDIEFAKADIPRLERKLAEYRAACDRKQGNRPRRRAISARFR